jgi:ABC-type ATPase with predicted acetyltransferase domain
MRTYRCANCDKTMLANETPMYCPYCGAHGKMMRSRREKGCSPEETASKLAALLPSYKAAYDAFVRVYAEVKMYKRRLDVAVSKGYYDSYKVPEIPPLAITEDAKKYRKGDYADAEADNNR